MWTRACAPPERERTTTCVFSPVGARGQPFMFISSQRVLLQIILELAWVLVVGFFFVVLCCAAVLVLLSEWVVSDYCSGLGP